MPRDRRKIHSYILTFYKTPTDRQTFEWYGAYTHCGRFVTSGTRNSHLGHPDKTPRVSKCPKSVNCKQCRDAAYWQFTMAEQKREAKKNAGLQPVRADNEYW